MRIQRMCWNMTKRWDTDEKDEEMENDKKLKAWQITKYASRCKKNNHKMKRWWKNQIVDKRGQKDEKMTKWRKDDAWLNVDKCNCSSSMVYLHENDLRVL